MWENWVDRRHLKTRAWMMVGLIQARVVSLTAWAPSVHSRAVSAPRLVRRFERWLPTNRIDGPQVYGPRIQQALAAWGTTALELARDTSTVWARYGRVRMSRSYRGRAVPIVWKVLPHPSRRVASPVYAA
jgi:hypothetical protein